MVWLGLQTAGITEVSLLDLQLGRALGPKDLSYYVSLQKRAYVRTDMLMAPVLLLPSFSLAVSYSSVSREHMVFLPTV